MAQTNADGSIILSTKVDESGLKAWFASVNSQSKMAQTNVKGIGKSAKQASTEAKTALLSIGTALKTLMSYLIRIQTILAAIRFSGASAEVATQTEASVQRLVDIYGSASDSVGDFIDANARALGMSKAAAASFSSVYGNLFSVWADQATNAELTNRYLNMTAVVASKTGRTVEDVQERVRSGLLGNTEAIDDLGIFVNVKTVEKTDAFQRMANGKSWERLDAYTQQQIRSMAILEQATAKYGDEVADTSATMRNRFNAAYQDFQNSWGNIVNTVLLPVLETLTQIFDIATKGLNALSGRSGQILENIELQEENTDKTAENIEEQTENQKELNKELKKSLAGFDDIQILSANTADNTSGGSDSGLQNIVSDSHFEETSQKIQDLAKVVAKGMIAIGCVLLATGNIGWGIGLIISGAATEGIVEASVGDGSSFQEIADKISNAIIIAGVIAIILGILLCMAQMWGLGIGLIIKGAVVVAGAVALNWNGIKEQLQGSFGGWLALGGIIAIVLGILLCFTPFLPLGIGLIVFGIGAVVAPIVANWDAIWNTITTIFAKIINWIETHGLAMLVLGCILCATGVALPIGLALIAFGIKGMVQAKDPTTNAIVDWIKGAWDAVKGFWNKYIAPVFTAKFWLDLAKTCGNGLIAGFEAAINGIITMFEKMINWIVDGLNSISIDVPDWIPAIGGKKFEFDIPRANFGRVSIPRLAQGTVVPPNKEFTAVLGDNTKEHEIVSPISTMKQAFMEAMVEMGGVGQTTKEEHYYLNEMQLMSILYRLVKGGERISGESLVDGGAF